MGVPDNGPTIVGVTWSLTLLAGALLGLRVYAKLSRKQGLWWDDHILIVSWVLLLSEAIITQVGQLMGFGKHTIDIPADRLATIALGCSVVTSISCFASTFSKISFGVTLLRLTKGPLRWFVWFCCITLFLVMLPSALSTWFQCTPMAKAWNPSLPGACIPGHILINYGIFNAAWCASADFALALLPWKLIWGLQLKVREKLGVGIAMSMGLFAGMCAIIKGLYLMQLAQQDFYYNGKDVTIWTVVETATAIIAASMPVLRVFFKESVSSYGNSHGPNYTHASSKTVPLSSLSRSRHSTLGKGKEGGWTTLEPIEDVNDDGSSQRRILRDEEHGTGKDGSVEHGGILQTNTISVTVDEDSRWQHKGRYWLGAPGV